MIEVLLKGLLLQTEQNKTKEQLLGRFCRLFLFYAWIFFRPGIYVSDILIYRFCLDIYMYIYSCKFSLTDHTIPPNATLKFDIELLGLE